MKYFTFGWWAGEVPDSEPPFRAYRAYLAENKPRFPADLFRLTDDVSLHDSRLRRLHLLPEKKTLSIEVDGCGADEGQLSYHPLKICLAYREVTNVESTADPEKGLMGPHGYGDIGYDEIEVLADGQFQHRLLFSSGIEFSITFGDFALTCQRADKS